MGCPGVSRTRLPGLDLFPWVSHGEKQPLSVAGDEDGQQERSSANFCCEAGPAQPSTNPAKPTDDQSKWGEKIPGILKAG